MARAIVRLVWRFRSPLHTCGILQCGLRNHKPHWKLGFASVLIDTRSWCPISRANEANFAIGTLGLPSDVAAHVVNARWPPLGARRFGDHHATARRPRSVVSNVGAMIADDWSGAMIADNWSGAMVADNWSGAMVAYDRARSLGPGAGSRCEQHQSEARGGNAQSHDHFPEVDGACLHRCCVDEAE